MGEQELVPKVTIDCEIKPEEIDRRLVDGLADPEPFGKDADPSPVLVAAMKPISVREVGEQGGHWKTGFHTETGILDGIWFNAGRGEPMRLGETCRVAFTAELNEWNRQQRVQVRVIAAE